MVNFQILKNRIFLHQKVFKDHRFSLKFYTPKFRDSGIQKIKNSEIDDTKLKKKLKLKLWNAELLKNITFKKCASVEYHFY